jgi:hypothetical protein
MPDLRDGIESHIKSSGEAAPFEEQTRAFFTRFGSTRQVPRIPRHLLQNPGVGGANGDCAGAGFWLGLRQFIDWGMRLRTSRRRRGQ